MPDQWSMYVYLPLHMSALPQATSTYELPSAFPKNMQYTQTGFSIIVNVV